MRRFVLPCITMTVIAIAAWRAWELFNHSAPVEEMVSSLSPTTLRFQVDLTPEVRDVMLRSGEIHEPVLKQVVTLKNKTEKPITIRKVGKSCSCQQVSVEKAVIPVGGSCELKVDLEVVSKHPGRLRLIREHVILETDLKDEAIRISLESGYIPPAYFLTDVVSAEADQSSPSSYRAVVSFFVNQSRQVDVTGVGLNPSPGMTSTVKEVSRVPAEDGTFSKVTYDVRIQEPREGALDSCVFIAHTNHPLAKDAKIRIILPKAKKAALISIVPELVGFGLVRRADSILEKSVVIRSTDGHPVRGISVTSNHTALKASFGKENGKSFLKLHCKFNPAEASNGDVSPILEVVVEINGVTVRQKIPVSAFVKEEGS